MSGTRIEYDNPQLGISFTYPSAWQKHISVKDKSAYGGAWSIELGPTCKGCAEGEDAATMTIEEFDPKTAKENTEIIQKAAVNTESSRVISYTSDMSNNGNRIFVFAEGGICGQRSAYVIGASAAVFVSGFCLDDSLMMSNLLDEIAVSVRFTRE